MAKPVFALVTTQAADMVAPYTRTALLNTILKNLSDPEVVAGVACPIHVTIRILHKPQYLLFFHAVSQAALILWAEEMRAKYCLSDLYAPSAAHVPAPITYHLCGCGHVMHLMPIQTKGYTDVGCPKCLYVFRYDEGGDAHFLPNQKVAPNTVATWKALGLST